MVNITKQNLNDLETKLKKYYDEKVNDLEGKYKKLLHDTKSEYEDKIKQITKQLTKTVDDKLAVMMELVKSKDEEIGNLNREIAGLQISLNHMSKDTAELDNKIKHNTAGIKKTNQDVNEVQQKATDLEDRSRRSNLVFFNISEEKRENCYEKITKLLQGQGIQDANTPLLIDRAHRLGKFKTDSRRPRPIIVKFTYFLDKEYVLKNGFKLAGSNINLSEDYSRMTLDIHKQLSQHAKKAKDSKVINNFQIKYKRVVVQVGGQSSDKFVYMSYDLKFIQDHPNNWFTLKPGTSTPLNLTR